MKNRFLRVIFKHKYEILTLLILDLVSSYIWLSISIYLGILVLMLPIIQILFYYLYCVKLEPQNTINEYTKNELLNNKYCDKLTVGQILGYIEKYKLKPDTIVLIERVPDVYFEKHGWKLYLKDGEYTCIDKNGNKIVETMDQYMPAFSCVRYNDDPDIMFIDIHY